MSQPIAIPPPSPPDHPSWWSPRLAYLLALVPLVTDWIDTGHFPVHAREYVTETVVGILIVLGVSQLNRHVRRLRELAEIDPLTGLRNRRTFHADLREAMARSARLGERFVLAYLDIDRFKAINDRLGHAEGDRVLQLLAASLRNSVRSHIDACYRLGGDELAVLLSGTDPAGALAAVERAFARQEVPAHLRPLSCSVGFVEYAGERTEDELVLRADSLMYAAKRGEPLPAVAGIFRRLEVGPGARP